MRKKRAIFLKITIISVIFISTFMILNFLNSKKYSVDINGMSRSYLLHTPRSDKTEKLPLVIALHGYSDHPRLMEFYSGWSRKADKEKFIVVYPYGTNSKNDMKLSWNGGSCCGNGVLENVDDIAFINSLTDELIKNYNIDKDKVYLTGFSNGSLLSYRLASETPERYKAIGIVSGTIGGKVYERLPEFSLSNPKLPISVILMHGAKDGLIPYNGGENKTKNGTFKSFKESSDFWKSNNVCESGVTTEDEIVKKEIYDNCKNNTRVELYSVKYGGHSWFGGIQEFFRNIKGESISATDTIWTFFEKN